MLTTLKFHKNLVESKDTRSSTRYLISCDNDDCYCQQHHPYLGFTSLFYRCTSRSSQCFVSVEQRQAPCWKCGTAEYLPTRFPDQPGVLGWTSTLLKTMSIELIAQIVWSIQGDSRKSKCMARERGFSNAVSVWPKQALSWSWFPANQNAKTGCESSSYPLIASCVVDGCNGHVQMRQFCNRVQAIASY